MLERLSLLTTHKFKLNNVYYQMFDERPLYLIKRRVLTNVYIALYGDIQHMCVNFSLLIFNKFRLINAYYQTFDQRLLSDV